MLGLLATTHAGAQLGTTTLKERMRVRKGILRSILTSITLEAPAVELSGERLKLSPFKMLWKSFLNKHFGLKTKTITVRQPTHGRSKVVDIGHLPFHPAQYHYNTSSIYIAYVPHQCYIYIDDLTPNPKNVIMTSKYTYNPCSA